MEKLLTQIIFPNGVNYSLYPEENLTEKCGISFPAEINERTLFVTGLSGSGKTTLVKKLCSEKGISYFEQVYTLLRERPYIATYDHNTRISSEISYEDVSKLKFLDGHFIFEFPKLSNDILFAHDKSICSSDYGSLNLNLNCFFDNWFKENFIFEFRQFSHSRIENARKERFRQELANGVPIDYLHIYTPRTDEEHLKGEYLFYQIAHKLFENGVDVYVRTDFDESPLRFAK